MSQAQSSSITVGRSWYVSSNWYVGDALVVVDVGVACANDKYSLVFASTSLTVKCLLVSCIILLTFLVDKILD